MEIAFNDALEIKRIAVALNPCLEGDVPILRAMELASRLEARLEALLVEDINFLHLAALPFASESMLNALANRQIDVVRVERMLNRRAEEIRQYLANFASERPLQWTLERVQGQVVSELERVAKASDLLVISWGCEGAIVPTKNQSAVSQIIHRSSCAILLISNTSPEVIGVWVRDPYQGRRSLEVAARLAKSQSLPLAIFISRYDEQSLIKWVRQSLKDFDNELRVIPVVDDVNLIRNIMRVYKGILVLDHHDFENNEGEFDRLVSGDGMSILILKR